MTLTRKVVVVVTVLYHFTCDPMALRWLPVFNIALCRLPALYYSTTLTPNNSVLHYKGSKHDDQTGCRIATPELAPSPTYSPALAPYRLPASGSTSRVSHKNNINKTQ